MNMIQYVKFIKKADTKILLFFIILLWLILQINFALPNLIVNDWMGWRQADTQTIARNFTKPGSNIFYPQINWGGNGPGYVESEFQLYTFIAAQIMKITGESVLPAQFLSMLFIVLTTVVIFYIFLFHFKDEYTSLFGAIFFLVSNGSVHLSTSIQPDSLCILFYTIAFFAFIKYLDNQKNSLLVLWILFSILAGLIKPLALNIGIIQFFLILFLKRNLLKSIKVWLGWFIIIGAVGSYLIFSYNLYLKYGNTFGVLGGDSKFPTIKGLTVLIHYPKLLYMMVLWGVGPIGLLAFLYLIFKKKIINTEWALIIGNAAAILIPMRYTVNSGFSPHYYIFTAFLGAWLATLGFQLFNDKIQSIKIRKYFPAMAVILLSITYSSHLYMRMNPAKMHFHPSVTKIGYKLKNIAEPKSLIIVRSIANEKETSDWGNRINNFEDPRIFYIADKKGWVLPRDYKGFDRVEKYVKEGAHYYAEPFRNPVDPELNKWLNANSKLIYHSKDGRIYKFERE